MVTCGTFQKLRPLSLLTHLCSSYDSTRLKVSCGTVCWSIYVEQGKILYASHTVEPFDRLDCHLRRLSHRIPTLKSEIRAQLRLLFENESEHPDYQAICWLVNNQYLNQIQATTLIEALVKEVIESFMLIPEGSYELGEERHDLPVQCKLDLHPIIQQCQKRLQGWQSLAPYIWSPYQRPYFYNQNTAGERLSPELQHKLSAILKGFSLRHLAILLNQEELQLAQSLYPYIKAGNIILHEPQPPFEQLPRTYDPHPKRPQVVETKLSTVDHNEPAAAERNFVPDTTSLTKPAPTTQSQVPRSAHALEKFAAKSASIEKVTPVNKIAHPSNHKSAYKVVCIDDSPAMLQELNHLLDDESFNVFTISDPVKALMQIVRIKPDLILLDVKMAGIDGYELCRLLRNHSSFKTIPIIMVTGNTGIIDRVKARFVGASGYLTKPFNQSDLLKIVFRHLT